MGVYIPNMEKPKRCIEELDYGLLGNPCLFVDERNACLLQEDSKIGEYEENYKTCPLIEIPTPHGRLIDADKVFCYNFWDEQNLDNAPTVIDREE